MKNKKRIIAILIAGISILPLASCSKQTPLRPTITGTEHVTFDESVSLSSYSNREILPCSENFPSLLAARYIINNKQLFHIKHGVLVMFGKNTASTFHLVVEDPDLVLYSQQGDILQGEDLITTGCYVTYKGKEHYDIVSLGDLDGNGKIDNSDIKEMEAFIGNRPENAESNLAFLAADANGSGNVTQCDIDSIQYAIDNFSDSYDIIMQNTPFDTYEPRMCRDRLDVIIKREDVLRKHESKKFYGEDVIAVSRHDYTSVYEGETWITVYFKKEYSAEELQSLRSSIELLPGVYRVDYISFVIFNNE